jgi:hypothetical protein
MKLVTAGAAACIVSALTLSGCFLGGGEEGPRPLGTAPDFVGSYRVSGDRLFMVTAGDTLSYCDGADRRERVQPERADTLEFALAGDRLTILNAPEAHAPGSPAVRTQWEAERAGSGRGLEGRWRIRGFDYRAVSGDLDAAARQAWDLRVQAMRRGNALGASEIELREGKAYARSDIRWADLFAAGWNGELRTDPAARAARDTLDIAVRVLDKFTVELKGNRTGETVRLAFAKDGTRSYASDRPEVRKAYAESREPAACPADPSEGWYAAFEAENAR